MGQSKKQITMNFIPFIPIFIPLIVAMNIRKYLNRFRNTGTTTPQASKTLEELKLRRSLIFKRLLQRNVIIEIGFERYYLHEENYKEYSRKKRIAVLIICAAMILIILIIMILSGIKF